MFKATHQQPDDSAERGISSARVKELLAAVEAEPPPETEPQDAHVWRGGAGRRRITPQEAEEIKRKMIGPRRRHFTLTERLEFTAQYEVMAEEPMPIPTSTHHHADILAARAARALAMAAPPPKPKPNRFVAAVKVLVGVDAPAAEAEPVKVPPKHKTFFG